MFFVISKLAWAALAPVSLMLGMAAIGAALLVAGLWRTGRALTVIGVGALVVTGVLPIGSLLLQPIEDRFPPLPDATPAPTGIVVLGGSTDQALTLARGRVTIREAGERLTEAVVLARRFPQARLVFSGGSAALAGSADTEAADARRLWTAMGVPDARITTEDRSRNTDENVRFTEAIVQPQPGELWILVTSAFHMPRAMALFRANDWPVIPDPVDYRTRGTAADWNPGLRAVENWERLDLALREWTGLVVYRLTGRTRTILPAP